MVLHKHNTNFKEILMFLAFCKLVYSKHSFHNYKNFTPRTLFSGFVAVQLVFLKPLVV